MGNVETPETKALSRAHAGLFQRLREVDETARPTSAAGPAQVFLLLRELNAELTEHFRVEQQSGYTDALLEQQPRLEHAIARLREEHRELAQSLEALITQAAAAISLDGGLRERIRDWVKRVRQHEIRENDLVQDAFNVDIGAED
jgi:hypothetical protein